MALTAKEEKFCQEYVKCLNIAKSARAAGYSIKTAREIGRHTLAKVDIQARIKEIQKELEEQTGITAHSIIMELAALSYWNIKDFIQDDNVIKDLSKMNKSKLKPIVGVKVKRTVTTVNDATIEDVTTELKMVDKKSALTDLGRHLGIFNEDNKLSVVTTSQVSDDQFRQLLAAARETKTNTGK